MKFFESIRLILVCIVIACLMYGLYVDGYEDAIERLKCS